MDARSSAAGDMDFTKSARAYPVIIGEFVYLLGAFGDLHCVKLDSGEIVWRCDSKKDFKSELPTWGWCSTPLQVGDLLIVNPGAPGASLVALDRRTGKNAGRSRASPRATPPSSWPPWAAVNRSSVTTPSPPGVGIPETGQRLWRLVPEFDGDFNVATPIVVGDKLLLCTENNGTRLYGLRRAGMHQPEPVATNEDLSPTPAPPSSAATWSRQLRTPCTAWTPPELAHLWEKRRPLLRLRQLHCRPAPRAGGSPNRPPPPAGGGREES